jgi:hypothetical protein
MPALRRNFWTAAPRASANVCVQVSEPPESHEPMIRIRAARCCWSQAAARFSVFLAAMSSSRLFGANGTGCLRKGGSESATATGGETVPETLERLSPEACCGLMRDPEGATVGDRERVVRSCIGNRSPANKSEVPNIAIFEYALTKNTA